MRIRKPKDIKLQEALASLPVIDLQNEQVSQAVEYLRCLQNDLLFKQKVFQLVADHNISYGSAVGMLESEREKYGIPRRFINQGAFYRFLAKEDKPKKKA